MCQNVVNALSSLECVPSGLNNQLPFTHLNIKLYYTCQQSSLVHLLSIYICIKHNYTFYNSPKLTYYFT